MAIAAAQWRSVRSSAITRPRTGASRSNGNMNTWWRTARAATASSSSSHSSSGESGRLERQFAGDATIATCAPADRRHGSRTGRRINDRDCARPGDPAVGAGAWREDTPMTTRRRLLLVICASLLPWSRHGRAQPGAKIPHIGYLSTGSLKINEAFLEALKDGLREAGYVDGRNIIIDVRWAGNMASEFPRLATALVENQPSAIITTCIPSTRAAKEATRTIPVVMSVDGDPVRAGLVASYARPGGNVTGTSTLFEELIPKWLEFITLAVPAAHQVAILSNPDDLIDPFYWAQFEQAAQHLGVKVLQFEASSPEEIDRAFGKMKAQGARALV